MKLWIVFAAALLALIPIIPDLSSFDMLRKNGVAEATVAQPQRGLRGASFDSVASMLAGLAKILGPQSRNIIDQQMVSRRIGPYRLFKVSCGPVVAYDGNGDGGQYLVIVPKAGIVAVRQINAGGDQEKLGQSYDDFIDRVLTLAEATGRLARSSVDPH